MAKKPAKKRAKKTLKKRVARKNVIESLARKPMKELVRTGGLVSEAISLKTQRTLQKLGMLYGPASPTASDKKWMAEQKAAASKTKRIESLARAREKKYAAQRYGPVNDPQARLQVDFRGENI